MPRPRSERLLLGLVLSGSVISLWQLALYHADNNFADGICAAIVRRERPPEERAMRLFGWVSSYDDPVPAPPAVADPARATAFCPPPLAVHPPRAPALREGAADRSPPPPPRRPAHRPPGRTAGNAVRPGAAAPGRRRSLRRCRPLRADGCRPLGAPPH